MWITSVTVDGLTVELDEVLADVVIRHGRAEADDAPSASTLQLTLRGMDRTYSAGFRVGVPLTIHADGAPRFTGSVTDAALDEDLLTVIAVGPLASLSRYRISGPGVNWPSERWSLRVRRAFAEAGVPELLLLQADPAFDPLLALRGTVAEPAETVSLLEYLGQLADDVGAAIFDTPDGHVTVQQLSARAMVAGLTWEMLTVELAWNEADPACSWQEATNGEALGLPPLLPELPIDPADVEYVPAWAQSLNLENEVTVSYGETETKVTVSEPSSLAHYGSYPGSLDTQLLTLADATIRAGERVDRRAYPRWNLPATPVLRGYPLQIGQVISLSEFPDPSPHETWRAVLEGWSDDISGDDWTSELALSDPIYSGVSLSWNDTPTGLAWNECEPACRWIDAGSLDALAPDFPALTRIGGSTNA